MTVRELSKHTGLSRQWINKLVDLGRIPNAARKENGRLEIQETEELKRWMIRQYNLQQSRQKRRLSVQDRINKLSKLEERDYLRPTELSEIIGNSPDCIRQQALRIPGVCLYQNGYRFKKTPELKKWVEEQCALMDAERCRYMLARDRRRVDFSLADQLTNLGRHIANLRGAIVRAQRSFDVADLDARTLDSLFMELFPISEFTFRLFDELKKRPVK